MTKFERINGCHQQGTDTQQVGLNEIFPNKSRYLYQHFYYIAEIALRKADIEIDFVYLCIFVWIGS